MPVAPLPESPLELEEADRSRYRDLLAALTWSARKAGKGALVSGQWLGETVVELAPRIPVRDHATLVRHYEGLDGAALTDAMIRSAGRVSATVGVTAGGLVALQELSLAGALAIPFELAAETALVVLIELKLVAELHQVADRPLPGGPGEQVAAAVRSWLSGRGVAGPALVAASGMDLLGRGTRTRLNQALRRRFTRNLTTLAPLLAGSAAAGWINRRFTLDVGRRVADDLGLFESTPRRLLRRTAW